MEATSDRSLDITSSKVDKMFRLSNTVLRLLLKGGVKSITHARLSKDAGVSRAWIYKYVGASREDLMDFSVKTIASQFVNLDIPLKATNPREWHEEKVEWISEMVSRSRHMSAVVEIYFRYRGSDDAIGECLRNVEEMYVRKSSLHFSKIFGSSLEESERAVRLIAGCQMGLAYACCKGTLSSVDALQPYLQLIKNSVESLGVSFRKN